MNIHVKSVCIDNGIIIFKKQDQAFNYMNSASSIEKYFIFSYEFGDKGQRAFLVSPSIEKLFKCIMNTPLNLRHYYELIPQFENCNLYLDIDFKLPPEKAEENKRNKQLYKNNLIDRIIIDEVKTHLKKTHPQVSDEIDSIEPLLLFSYQYDKYSLHLHWPLKTFHWKDNEHLGEWVKQFVIERSIFTPELNYIDTSVYSKFRNFRLMGNKKFSKSIETILRTTSKDKTLETFEKTIITSSNFQKQNDTGIDEKILTFNGFESLKNIGRTTVDVKRNQHQRISCNDLISLEGMGLSLDECNDIKEIETHYGHGFKVRKVKKASNSLWILLDHYTKHCKISQRIHKSNNVFIGFNINERYFWYDCTDEECKKKTQQKKIQIKLNQKKNHETMEFDEDFFN
ncbi:hypothetical protein ACTFIY_011419 [Dictyostelium cf. discoideum]